MPYRVCQHPFPTFAEAEEWARDRRRQGGDNLVITDERGLQVARVCVDPRDGRVVTDLLSVEVG